MAKNGFPYYGVDTDRYQDIRIKRLKKNMNCEGIAVYDYILCEIYRVQGCYIDWDENTNFDVSEYFGLKETRVSEIVNYCCAVGLFNKELFTKERVLTSKSIQTRYVDMCNRSKRKNIIIPEKIQLIPKTLEETPKTPEEMPKTPEESDIRKHNIKEDIKKIPSVPKKKTEETFLNFIELNPAPEDGLDRNYEGLLKKLETYQIPLDKVKTIIKMSNYAEISAPHQPILPVWSAIHEILKGTIHSPAEFIISKIRKHSEAKGICSDQK